MDLEEWEFIPDDGFLEIHDDGGKKIFSRKYSKDSANFFNRNYFICPSPKSQKFVDSSEDSRLPNQLVPLPIQLDPTVEKATDHDIVKEISKVPILETDQDSVSQVFFKKMKENEFVDMKMDSPKSSSRGIMAQIDSGTFQFEEKGEVTMENKNSSTKMTVEEEKNSMDHSDMKEESNAGLKIWKWSFTGIGAICSFGVAAATICIIIFGTGQGKKQHQQNHQKIRFQLYSDDKRINQVVHHASKLNEAISAVRGVPLTRAHVTFGGYHDGL